MILYYYDKPKSSLPYNCTPVKIEDIDEVKTRLKELLDENEGKESVVVSLYDAKINDQESLMDYFKKYLNLSVFDVVIIDPLKPYSLPNANSVSVVVSFARPKAMDRINRIKSIMPYARTHLIDDYRYSIINVERTDFDPNNRR